MLIKLFLSLKTEICFIFFQEESPDYTLHFGTSTFIDKSIKPHSEFSGKLKQIYNSSIIKVPFKQPDNVVAEVNSWAKLVTHGYIEKFLSKGIVLN